MLYVKSENGLNKYIPNLTCCKNGIKKKKLKIKNLFRILNALVSLWTHE